MAVLSQLGLALGEILLIRFYNWGRTLNFAGQINWD